MPRRQTSATFRHVFDGGWATDFGQTTEINIDAQNVIRIPFLTECLNNFFELDGGTHKIGGTTRTNSTVITSSEEIVGLFDYWKQGVGGSPARKLVCHAGTAIYAATLDSNFSDISTAIVGALVNNVVPCYETFDDLLIISSASTNVPFSWDQITFQNLAGSPPNFAFSEAHKNRLWAAGVNTLPSRLYYSALLDPEDWTGAGSGFIDIDPSDGDAITGLASHKDNLWVFKGPYKGSIHRIVGSAPTGGDSFGRQTFIRGLGAVNHNSIFRFRDDLGFMWSDGSIHSLSATSAFGDFNDAALSRPINGWLRAHINGSRLKYSWAATDSVRGYTLFTLPVDSSTNNNVVLMMDFRFSPVRWSRWDAFSSGCLAPVVDSGIPTIFDGSNDGYVRRLQRPTRSIDGTGSINSMTQLPFIDYGTPINMKVIERMSAGISPKGVINFTFAWQRDDLAEQSVQIAQAGIGGLLDLFVLDVDQLGGATFADRFHALEEGGEFRSISYSVENNEVNQDLEVHTISATINVGADSGEN
jgi:hypothetical protein